MVFARLEEMNGRQFNVIPLLLCMHLWISVACSQVIPDLKWDSKGVCTHCKLNASAYSRNSLEGFCALKKGKLVSGRCCYDSSTQELIGLDLSNCNLKNIADQLHGNTQLRWIAADANPLANCNADDFMGMAELEHVILPSALSCPGEAEMWTKSRHNSKLNIVECFNELNPCHVLNASCPDSSHCSPYGPGIYECLCDPGYYGYKCLHQGVFPWASWMGGIFGGTAGLILLLALAQRPSLKRGRKKSH